MRLPLLLHTPLQNYLEVGCLFFRVFLQPPVGVLPSWRGPIWQNRHGFARPIFRKPLRLQVKTNKERA